MKQFENILGLLIFIINLGVGLLSFFAISDWIGGGIVAYSSTALLVMCMPLIGTVVAIFGAIKVWDWEWYVAILVFMWPLLLDLLGLGVDSLYTLLTKKKG